MDHGQTMKAPLIVELLALCQQIAKLEPAQLTPAVLDEMISVALIYAEGIMNTVRVPLVVLDATLHVLMANRYFYECFQVTPLETESHQLYNLGNGQGFSVREVIDTARAVTGKPIPATEVGRRAGDPAVLVASSGLIKAELGWVPEKPGLDQMVADAWTWTTANLHRH